MLPVTQWSFIFVLYVDKTVVIFKFPSFSAIRFSVVWKHQSHIPLWLDAQSIKRLACIPYIVAPVIVSSFCELCSLRIMKCAGRLFQVYTLHVPNPAPQLTEWLRPNRRGNMLRRSVRSFHCSGMNSDAWPQRFACLLQRHPRLTADTMFDWSAARS